MCVYVCRQAIESARGCRIFGVILGTLGRQGNQRQFDRIISLLRSNVCMYVCGTYHVLNVLTYCMCVGKSSHPLSHVRDTTCETESHFSDRGFLIIRNLTYLYYIHTYLHNLIYFLSCRHGFKWLAHDCLLIGEPDSIRCCNIFYI